MPTQTAEQALEKRLSIREAVHDLASHPVRHFMNGWNWKAAIFSATIRGCIFLLATMKRRAVDMSLAVAVELAFSTFVAGVSGAFTQCMRFATPEWATNLVFAIVLPSTLLLLDGLAHLATGMTHMRASLIGAGMFSMLASLFNLYIMRKGALLVGGRGGTLLSDMTRMPRLVLGFLLVIPCAAWRYGALAMQGWERNLNGSCEEQ